VNRRGFLQLLGILIPIPSFSSPVFVGIDLAARPSVSEVALCFYDAQGRLLSTSTVRVLVDVAWSDFGRWSERLPLPSGASFSVSPSYSVALAAGRTLVDGFHQLSPWGVTGNREGGGELVDGSMAVGGDSGWWKPSTGRPPTSDKLLKNKENSHGIHPPPVHQLERGPYAEASRTVAPRRGAYRLACGKVRSE
jgi:hypothetical protein